MTEHAVQTRTERKMADAKATAPACHARKNGRLMQLAAHLHGADSALQLKAVSERMQRRPNRTGLPDRLKSGIEALSGMSADHIRVHRNSPKPAQFRAHAFAQGSDIHLSAGQEHHLPHEAWHIVQQAQGRVRPTMQMQGGVAANTDHTLEREADIMGARAMRLQPE